jgi:hypothetical protein
MTLVQTFCIAALICSDIRVTTLSSCESRANNIALVGFMGTGKSSVGRLAAEHLRFAFIDTDELIENEVGKSIPKSSPNRAKPPSANTNGTWSTP